jgi:hypothetical protein
MGQYKKTLGQSSFFFGLGRQPKNWFRGFDESDSFGPGIKDASRGLYSC